MAKPTGTKGYLRVQVSPEGNVVSSFEKIPFSKDKAAIERMMAERFIASMNAHLSEGGSRFFLEDPRHNSEDDFDFTVGSPNGPAHLELMEIAPLDGPYDRASSRYRSYDFANVILSEILKKSAGYPTDSGREVFLLLYVTHWAFVPSDITYHCLRYWLNAHSTMFRAIFSYVPLDEKEGTPHWLFPVPPELIGAFDPERHRDDICVNLKPDG